MTACEDQTTLPPERLTLRAAEAADAAAIARVHAEAWQQAYRDLLPAELVEGFSEKNRQALWRGLFAGREAPLVEVAEIGEGRLAGFAWMRRIEQADAAFDGEIIAIAVSPPLQGRGYGRRLMAAAARRLRACQAGSVYLWVYRDNRAARGFYERLGGRMVDRDVERHEGWELPIVAYAWKPIDRLTGTASGVAERRP